MPVRQLLNVAYAALASNAEDVDQLDRELEEEPRPVGQGRTAPQTISGQPGGMATVMRFGKMGGQR